MVYRQNYLIYSFLVLYRKKLFLSDMVYKSLKTVPTPTKSLFLLCIFRFKIYCFFAAAALKDLFLLMRMSVCLHTCLYIMCVNALTNQTRIPLNCDYRWLLAIMWIREIKKLSAVNCRAISLLTFQQRFLKTIFTLCSSQTYIHTHRHTHW